MATSRLTTVVAIFFVTVGFILLLIGVATPDWSHQDVSIPDGGDPRFGRGLWQAYFTNGQGVYTILAYDTTDNNGDRQDPFCGSSTANNSYILDYPGFASAQWASRDHDTNGWCNRKRVTQAFSLLSLIFAFLCFMISGLILKKWFPLAFLVLGTFGSVIFGVVATAVYAAWITDEQGSRDTRAIDSEGQVSVGYSFGLFIAGWVLEVVAMAFAFLSMCFGGGKDKATAV